MNDYIEDGLFLSADTSREVIELISNKKKASESIKSNSVFKEESLYLTNKSVKEIINHKSFND